MVKNVQEELPLWLECPGNLCHEKLIVLHVLEKLNRHHPIERICLKLIIDDVSRNDLDVFESLCFRLLIYVCLLRSGIRERGNLCVGIDLRNIKRSRPPATPFQGDSQPQALLYGTRYCSHPRSRILMPSFRSARSVYSSSISTSAWSKVSLPVGYKQALYFILGPKQACRIPVPTS